MSFVCDFREPVVQTQAGKLRGFRIDDMYYFRGIRYAKAERFHQPEPVEPWEGVRDAVVYGYTCPPTRGFDISLQDQLCGFRYWPWDEDCLNLNVWTRSINDDTRKPVMVWIHGGGFDKGSSVELLCYEAENLCRDGDVVVVSINHRLNVLGYLNLSAYGEQYRYSGSAGLADITASLQWIKDNISRFGGDPDNVTIFGQSGGGMKVNMMMQIPAADGLFHKAIIESGVMGIGRGNPAEEDSLTLAKAITDELGLDADSISRIETMPLSDIVNAWRKVSPKLKAQGVNTEFSPVPDGYYLGNPMEAGFTEKAKRTPVIAGTSIAEMLLYKGEFHDADAPEDEKERLLRETFGKGTDIVWDLFRKAYPGKSMTDLMYYESTARSATLDYVRARAAYSDISPVYTYILSYDFPFNGGTPAWHAAELPLVFRSWDRVPVFCDDGVKALGEVMSRAWIAFAHTGDPGTGENPWDPYTPDREATMVFDENSGQRISHDRELLEAHKKYAPKFDIRDAVAKQK